ncbi:hypothetical protein TNCV_3373651 [Trichonephila clavipes]|nr:hypothetical protein TNCV_3373651 [Trichonephila clavipes]
MWKWYMELVVKSINRIPNYPNQGQFSYINELCSWARFRDRGCLVVMNTNSYSVRHVRLYASAAEDPPCTGCSLTLSLSCFKRPLDGMVRKLEESVPSS